MGNSLPCLFKEAKLLQFLNHSLMDDCVAIFREDIVTDFIEVSCQIVVAI